MFGKCPKCKAKLKVEELSNLKKGEAARCYGCGRLFVPKPLWIYLRYLIMFLPLLVAEFNLKFLTLLSSAVTFYVVVFYHDLQAYMPLIEENKL